MSVRDDVQPTVEWDKLHHDFGFVAAAPPLQCTFVVHNTSTQPMAIQAVRPSCGCITHELTSRLIKQGASCRISVEVATKGVSPPADISKHVDVAFEQNGHRHSQRLTLSAQLRPAVSIDPSPLVLTANTFDGVAKGWVTIRREVLTPESFLTIAPRAPECYGYSTIKHTRDEFVFEISTAGGALPARLPPLTLKYQDFSGDRTLTVPVHLVGDQDVRVVPPSHVVTIGSGSTVADLRTGLRKVARLESTRGESLRIVDVQSVADGDKDAFSWSIDPDSPDSIELTVVDSPADATVHSTRFDIIFERGSDGSQGRAVLRAYVVVTGKAVASTP
jgi:hypothetical protein